MKRIELLLWCFGITSIALFFAIHAWAEVQRQRDITLFSDVQQSDHDLSQTKIASLPTLFEDAATPTATRTEQPQAEEILAILRISDIRLELPVRYGTEERVLRRGPGLIEGTAPPGSNGNVAIAAHRDMHFRGLKDLQLGDLIELEAPNRIQTYIVIDLSVVEPTDVHVLDETGYPALTLVTCYPFYFVGNAPKRYIVRAEAVEFVH